MEQSNYKKYQAGNQQFIATFVIFLVIIFIFLGFVRVVTLNSLRNSALNTKPVTVYFKDSSFASISIDGAMINAEVASTEKKKEQGLSDIHEIPEGKGMLFVFDKLGIYPFWNQRTYIPLDILWIANDKVVHILKNMPTDNGGEKYIETPKENANFVLEINTGFIDKYNVKIGDKVIIQKTK